MSWFRRDKPKIEGQDNSEERTVKTEGIFVKCPECETPLYKPELIDQLQVCSGCDHHFRFGARERLKSIFDDGKIRNGLTKKFRLAIRSNLSTQNRIKTG